LKNPLMVCCMLRMASRWQPMLMSGFAQGVLEGSNVNAISAMVDMIELARNSKMQTKVMKSVDENSAVGAKLMQM